MLSEIATRVLASIKSFSATNAASAAHVAALQRVGSFAPPKGVDLAEALQRAAHEGPCDRHAPTPGGGAGGEDSSAASRPSSADAATAAAAADGSCDEVRERNLLAGADVCAASAIRAPKKAGPNAPTSGGGAVAEAQMGIGGAGSFARLRRRAESGEQAPCRSNLTTAGDSLTWAAAPDPACGGRPAGAEQARSPLAAAPVLGTSGAADARNGSSSAATADIISSEVGADVKQKAVTEDEHKTGSFRQKLKQLLLIRALGPSTSAGRAPGAGAPDAEIQQAVQSEKDLRHEQVLALAAPSPWVLPTMSSSSMENKSG